MPIAVDSYYSNTHSLNNIEESFREMLELLEDLYLRGPVEGAATLSYIRFCDYCVVSAVMTISKKLKENQVSFATTLLSYFRNVYVESPSKSLEYRSFYINRTYERAVIFGCVYYILSLDNDFPKRHLSKIEGLIDEKDKPYFNVFKDAADKKMKQENVETLNIDTTEAKKLQQELQYYKRETEDLRAKLEVAQSKLNEIEKDGETVELLTKKLEQYPRLLLIWKMMRECGASSEEHGNKRIINNILSIITNYPYSSCKHVWDHNHDQSVNRQPELIAQLNTYLKQVGMSIQL